MTAATQESIIVLEKTIPPEYRVDRSGVHQRSKSSKYTTTWKHVSNTPCWISKLKINENGSRTDYEYMVTFLDALGNHKSVWIEQDSLLTRGVASILRKANAVCIDQEANALIKYFSKSIAQASKNVDGVY